MFLFLKMNFRKKNLPWLCHHKWSNSSEEDTRRVQSRNADGVLGNRAPFLPLGPPWNAWRAGAWGLWPPVPVCKESIWQQCSHTPLRLLSSARGGDFPCHRMKWTLAPTSLQRRCHRRKDKQNWVRAEVFLPEAPSFFPKSSYHPTHPALPLATIIWPHLWHKWQNQDCFAATGKSLLSLELEPVLGLPGANWV